MLKVILLDVNHLSLRPDSVGLSIFKECIRIDQAYFPECLGRSTRARVALMTSRSVCHPIFDTHFDRARAGRLTDHMVECFFFLNSPWIFRPLWAMVRPWLDPITKRKFHVLGTAPAACCCCGQ